MVLIDIQTDEEFHHYRNHYPLVIVMFTADYCNQCRIMEPIYRHKSGQYPRKVMLVVDCKRITKHAFELHAMPAFVKYKDGVMVQAFTGDDCSKLDRMLTNHIEPPVIQGARSRKDSDYD